MAFFCFILAFVLSHLVVLPLATNENRPHHPECSDFECGRLGSVRFPFANSSLPNCGLYPVKDCNKTTGTSPKIRLKSGGRWFNVVSISQANVIHINDTDLRLRIKSRDCSVLNDLTIPTSASSSLSTLNNQTLFNCSEAPKSGIPLYISSFSCPGYYTNLNFSNSNLPNCSKVFIPVRPVGPNNPSIQFTSDFQLQVTVSRECYECFYRGGNCQTTHEGKFKCAVETPKPGEKREKKILPIELGEKASLKHLKVILCVGIPVIFLCALVLGLWLYRKRFATPNFRARSVSQLYSKSQLEGGHVFFEVPIFSYSELEEATNKFDHDKELGRGGFGAVYFGKLQDGREVAVKRLYQQTTGLVADQFMNEVKILTRLRHKNLVPLYGCTSRSGHELLLVYEFVPNGTLADHLHGKRANPCLLTWPIRMSIAIEIASALAHLHALDIIHRDVKSNNILLDNSFCVKVADFGISRMFPNDVSHISTAPQGTFGYIDPQYFQYFQLTTKSDVYAFGVVLIELISSMPAVDRRRQSNEIGLVNLAVNRIQNEELQNLIDPQLGFLSDNEVRRMATSVARLAFRCLQNDREKRPTMEEALEVLKRIASGEEEPESEEDDSVLLKKFETPNIFPSEKCCLGSGE